MIQKHLVTKEQLKIIREKLGDTQQELARRLGVSRQSVIRWETGRTLISKRTEAAIESIIKAENLVA